MYTTFIVDEVGNRRIIMDWFKSTRPTFGWSEVSVETLLESHPNHVAGLEFAYYFTGDDSRPQSDAYVSAEYGLLPDFRAPDLPAPRTAQERTGQYTRTSEERRSVPVRFELKEVGPTAKPRIRCGLCAWNLGLLSKWSGPGPEQNSPPPAAERPDHLAGALNELIKEGKTSRRRLAEAISHKKRWALVDRWCQTTMGRNLPRSPSDAQLEELLTAIDGPPIDRLMAALEHDREHCAREAAVLRWRALRHYHPWAETTQDEDGVWYRHKHCGRTTNDLEEVNSVPEVLALKTSRGMVDAVLEHWSWYDRVWSSLAFRKESDVMGALEELEQSVREVFGLDESKSLKWHETDKFWFVTES